MNLRSLPETVEWLRRIGYQVSTTFHSRFISREALSVITKTGLFPIAF